MLPAGSTKVPQARVRLREIPADVDGFDLLAQRLEHVPLLGFGDIRRVHSSADTPGQRDTAPSRRPGTWLRPWRSGSRRHSGCASANTVGGRDEGLVHRCQGLAGHGRGGRDRVRGPVAILATGRDGANGLHVDGRRRAQDTIAQTPHNRLFHVQEGHDVEQLLELQGRYCLLDLEETRDGGRQQVITAPLATAIAPLGQTDDGIGLTAAGQEQMGEGRAARPHAGGRRNPSPGAA